MTPISVTANLTILDDVGEQMGKAPASDCLHDFLVIGFIGEKATELRVRHLIERAIICPVHGLIESVISLVPVNAITDDIANRLDQFLYLGSFLQGGGVESFLEAFRIELVLVDQPLDWSGHLFWNRS